MTYRTRRALENGLAYLREHGWTQGQTRDPDTGAVCASGALELGNTIGDMYLGKPGALVFHPGTNVNAAYRALCIKAGEMLGRDHINVITFNDEHATCQQDIETLFEKTIAECT